MFTHIYNTEILRIIGGFPALLIKEWNMYIRLQTFYHYIYVRNIFQESAGAMARIYSISVFFKLYFNFEVMLAVKPAGVSLYSSTDYFEI